MLTFNYVARDTTVNKIVKSSVQAETESEAARLLMAQHIVPLKISLDSEKKGIMASMRSHISTKERVIFTRQLATLINAGLPLVQSLNTVEEQTQNEALKSVVGQIIGNVNGGASLADSFAKYPKIFNQVFFFTAQKIIFTKPRKSLLPGGFKAASAGKFHTFINNRRKELAATVAFEDLKKRFSGVFNLGFDF